jgi:antitoxin HicB
MTSGADLLRGLLPISLVGPWADRQGEAVGRGKRSGRVSRKLGMPDRFQELSMGKRYAVSDGKMMLNLEEAEEGGYIVTSPLNPELITQAETIEEAFVNARDAAKALRQSWAKLMRRMSASKTL